MKLPVRSDNGQFPAWAWPGGYPLVYWTRRGDVLCSVCASKPEATEQDATDPVTDCDVFWEGPSHECADCGTEIESAYGDPDSGTSDDS